MTTAAIATAIAGANTRRPAHAPATSNARLSLDMHRTLQRRVLRRNRRSGRRCVVAVGCRFEFVNAVSVETLQWCSEQR